MIFTNLGKLSQRSISQVNHSSCGCNLNGIMSRLAAKCRAETIEKKLYSAGSQSTALEIFLMFLLHFMINKT